MLYKLRGQHGNYAIPPNIIAMYSDESDILIDRTGDHQQLDKMLAQYYFALHITTALFTRDMILALQ